MTDRINHITVVLDRDIRDDDAEYILNAIRMVKGVLRVEPNVVSPSDYMAEERAKQELRTKLWDVLK